MRGYEFALQAIRDRLPARDDTMSVFNVTLFVVFGWSIRGFLFEIPSFLLYLGFGDILAIVFYMMAFAFLESIILTGGLVIVSMIIPSGMFKDGFSYKGFLIILVATLGFILFQGYYKVGFFQNFINNDYSPLWPLFLGSIISMMVLGCLIWLFQKKPRLQKYLLYLIEQFGIFAYIYIPLGLIGLLVVFVRNIF